MLKKAAFGLFFSLLIAFSACLEVDSPYSKLAPGRWRAVLELEPHPPMPMGKKDVARIADDFLTGDLCFNFDVVYDEKDQFAVEIVNGEERIKCDSIQWWRTKNSAYDTLVVHFPVYQSYIRAVVRERLMEGEFVVPAKNQRIPFKAKHGVNYRFTNMNEAPTGDLTGAWAATFGVGEEKTEAAVGEFRQKGNHLEGTFRTETGDYRFLEGTVQGRRFYLSAFDGSHAFLFAGQIHGPDSLDGEFRSGKTFRQLWTARRDAKADLRSATALTKIKSTEKGIRFAYSTPEGKKVALPSKELDGKVKIVQIMGSWCPNCLDETEFLVDYFSKNPSPEVAVIGLAFERHKDPKLANEQVSRYKKLKNIPYDLVWAGPAHKDSVKARLPMLDDFMAFPTLIVVDKKDQVRQIHTGFDGPATSRFAAFRTEFDSLIQKLKAE